MPAVPEELRCLAEAQTEFEKFTSAVLEDLSEKMANLRRFKSAPATGYQDRSYAALQIFMLHKYSSRIKTFKTGSVKLIENICTRFEQKESPARLSDSIDRFRNGLSKMKTRMKHMIDVSDKYALVEIFDTINMINHVSLAMDQGSPEPGLHSFLSLSSLRTPSSPLPPDPNQTRKSSYSSYSSHSSTEERQASPHVKTLRSLSDHVCVLSKTYVTAVYKRS